MNDPSKLAIFENASQGRDMGGLPYWRTPALPTTLANPKVGYTLGELKQEQYIYGADVRQFKYQQLQMDPSKPWSSLEVMFCIK